MDDDQQFCLRWNNHQSTLVAVFDKLLENETLVDCTLAAEGKCLQAHKVVLSACSSYFELLLSRHFDKHPIVVLKDVKFQELKAMMDYMYRGEVNISQDQLGALLRAAESLQIRGLSDNKRGETERKQVPTPSPLRSSIPASPSAKGLTIEQHGKDDSRDGSLSPSPRKKKRLRRNSEKLDNHDASKSSESNSLRSQCIHTLPVGSIKKIQNADVPEPSETQSDILMRHKKPDEIPQVPIVKETIETHTELLEPKSEYVEEMNEGSIEDLTVDDDNLDNMEQVDNQPGPSHGTLGESSSQGFGGWHMSNQSQDEEFFDTKEPLCEYQDTQGNADVWVEQLLLSWGCDDEVISSFKENGIDKTSFELLEESTISELIKKIGPRVIFLKKFRNFTGRKRLKKDETVGMGNEKSTTTKSTDDSTYKVIAALSQGDDVNLPVIVSEGLVDVDSLSALMVPPSPPPLSPILSGVKRPTYSHESTKKFRTDEFVNDLDCLLKNHPEGPIFLNKKNLNSETRQRLTNIIINDMLAKNKAKKITGEQFEEVARQIEELFPSESQYTYYIPYTPKSKGGPKMLPRGKLFSRYINIKRKIKESSKLPTEDSLEEEMAPPPGDPLLFEMNFLKTCCKLDDQFIEFWAKTFINRRILTKDLSIAENFELFPALKQDRGFVLFLNDFNLIYPGKSDIYYKKWPEIAPKLVELARQKNLNLDSNCEVNTLAIKVLPYLFSPKTLKNNGKIWRPSKLECQESFILIVESNSDLENILVAKKEKLKYMNLAFQPQIVVVGSISHISACYVLVNEVKYLMDSPMKAVDICFKLYSTFNVTFPRVCADVWYFLQKGIYSIETKHDQMIPSVVTVLKELDLF